MKEQWKETIIRKIIWPSEFWFSSSTPHRKDRDIEATQVQIQRLCLQITSSYLLPNVIKDTSSIRDEIRTQQFLSLSIVPTEGELKQGFYGQPALTHTRLAHGFCSKERNNNTDIGHPPNPFPSRGQNLGSTCRRAFVGSKQRITCDNSCSRIWVHVNLL